MAIRHLRKDKIRMTETDKTMAQLEKDAQESQKNSRRA